MNTHKIDRALTPDEIREITAECEARDNRSSTPPEEWRAVAEGDGWTLCKIDTLPDFFALLNNVADPLLLYRDDIPDQLDEADAIASGYGPVVATDGGDYELVAHIYDDGRTDESINLYVGRAADGHHDMIASDNASMWVVAELNRDHWDAIAGRCDVAPVLDEVRKIDAALADWLTDRYNEAKRTVVIYNGDALRDDGYNDGVVVAPAEDLGEDTIKAIWDELPNECILEIGLGDDKVYAHFAPFDGDGDPARDNRTIDGMADCKAAYYVAPWDAECGDDDCDMWDLYNSDGTAYDGADA